MQETLLTSDISGKNVTRGLGVKRCPCPAVVSNSSWPHGLYSPWNSPGQNTGVGNHPLLQIFPTQGSNPGLPHCKWILYQAEPPRKAKEIFIAWQRSVNLEGEALVRTDKMKENSALFREGGEVGIATCVQLKEIQNYIVHGKTHKNVHTLIRLPEISPKGVS